MMIDLWDLNLRIIKLKLKYLIGNSKYSVEPTI